ncbi:hypothetical protein COP1_014764 [Malus domestica]
MGNRLGRAYAGCYGGQMHDDHGNRLLHQMGRSRTYDDHDSDGHRALHMEESFADLASLSPLSLTTARNLWEKIWRSSSKNTASNNTRPRQDILKVMGRPKHPTRRSSTASRNPSPTKRENGQMSSLDVYGHIAPPKDE